MKLVALLERVQKALDGFHPVRAMGLSADEMALLQPLQLLTAKPALYIANVDEKGFENNPLLERVKEYAKKEGAPVVAICAKLEAEIAGPRRARRSRCSSPTWASTEPGLNRLIRATYDLLGLQTYFTAGEKEVRAWTMRKGATAPQAAGVIHTDFEKGFIRAEVIAYDDYVHLGGEAKAKEARQDAPRGQGVRREGRRRDALPLQRLTRGRLRGDGCHPGRRNRDDDPGPICRVKYRSSAS